MIIGVTGPLCAGKDCVSEILREKGFQVFSFGDVIRDEMKSKGIELTRDNLQTYANKLREKEGVSVISKRIISRLGNGNYLIQGFRNPGELEDFKKLDNFLLISLECSQRLRFERMKSRNREKDPVNFEDFKKIDDMELLGANQENFGFSIGKCMEMADRTIMNEGSFEDLKEEFEKVLDELKAKF